MHAPTPASRSVWDSLKVVQHMYMLCPTQWPPKCHIWHQPTASTQRTMVLEQLNARWIWPPRVAGDLHLIAIYLHGLPMTGMWSQSQPPSHQIKAQAFNWPSVVLPHHTCSQWPRHQPAQATIPTTVPSWLYTTPSLFYTKEFPLHDIPQLLHGAGAHASTARTQLVPEQSTSVIEPTNLKMHLSKLCIIHITYTAMHA